MATIERLKTGGSMTGFLGLLVAGWAAWNTSVQNRILEQTRQDALRANHRVDHEDSRLVGVSVKTKRAHAKLVQDVTRALTP